MKKRLILFLCGMLIAVFVLSACSTNGSDASTKTQPSQTSSGDKTDADKSEAPKEVSLEGVELSYWVPFGGTSRQEIQDFSKNLAYMEKEKQTDVKVEWIHPPEGQENETFAIMIASDDLPDLIETADKYKETS